MKKTALFALLVAASALSSCEKDEIVPVGSLPSASTQYISTHFPSEQILQVKRDKDLLQKVVFEVILSSNFELEFKEGGDARKVDGNGKAIPEAVIQPSAALTYIQEQFAGQYAVSWEKDNGSKNEVEIELNNGLELKFDKDGKFLRLED